MSSIFMFTMPNIKLVKPSMFDATVIIAGITIVVAVLLLLIFIFYLFGKLVPMIEKASNKRAQKKAAKKAAKEAKKSGEPSDAQPALKPVAIMNNSASKQAPPVVEQGISGEVVAAITAAIVATEGGNVVVRSIRKKAVSSRNPWAQAANIDNTRPF